MITKLRTQYLEMANREAEWSARYGPDHLASVNLRNRMREVRNSILDELRRIAESYKSDYQIALQREQAIQKELAQAVSKSQETNQAQVVLHELESNAQTYRTLYDNFLQRYMETVQQQSFPITESRVISAATRPLVKSHPKTLLIIAISGLGGIMVGFGIALLGDLSDRVFRTTEQVESLLRTACIAIVPKIEGAERKARAKRPIVGSALASLKARAVEALHLAKKPETPVEPRTIVRRPGQEPLWSVVDTPFSRFTEAIRAIKLAADLNSVVKSNKVIGLTSSLPGEGKSTLATALAQLIAQAGRNTMLVDCDIRNPSLSRELTPDAKAGILEVIAGIHSLEEVIYRDPATNMAFLPAVAKSQLAHSSEILASEATKALFAKLRQHYEHLVVDLSPLAPVVDVRTTTHLVDAYVLVIEWGRTKINVVEHALSGARGVYDNLLGAVLNKTDMRNLEPLRK